MARRTAETANLSPDYSLGEALTFIITAQGIQVSGLGRVMKIIQSPPCGLTWTEHDDRPQTYIFQFGTAFPMKSEGCEARHFADYGAAMVLGAAPESRPSPAPRARKPEDQK